jgi:hypothetical protein
VPPEVRLAEFLPGSPGSELSAVALAAGEGFDRQLASCCLDFRLDALVEFARRFLAELE